jgi:hypothetical protein
MEIMSNALTIILSISLLVVFLVVGFSFTKEDKKE